MSNSILMITAAGGLAAANLLVSLYLAKRDDLSLGQKVGQCVLVWLIPILGALGIWFFHRNNDNAGIGKRPVGGGPNDSIGVSKWGD